MKIERAQPRTRLLRGRDAKSSPPAGVGRKGKSSDHPRKAKASRRSSEEAGLHGPSRVASKCRIVIVDGHDFTREGMKTILKRSRAGYVSGLAASERDAMQMVESQRPDIVIMDLFLGSRDGLSLIKDLVARYPETKVLSVCGYSDLTYAERAIKAGARGFLMKNAGAEHLLAAVEKIHAGGTYLTRRCAVLTSGKPASRGTRRSDRVDRLTDRELHVFQLFGAGLGTGKIAEELGLSRKTIESYSEAIKRKLGCANAAALKERAKQWLSEVEGNRSEPETGDFP